MSIGADAPENAGAAPAASAAPPCPPRGFPPARPAVTALLKERGLMEQTLVGNGVAARDVPDQVQEVLLLAWEAIRAGRFRPDPEAPTRQALRFWVRGIAWRIAAHHEKRRYVRLEVPSGDTRELLAEVAGPGDLHGQVEAREALHVIAHHEDRGMLLAVAVGDRLRDYARAEGMASTTAHRHLWRARVELAARLGGGGL